MAFVQVSFQVAAGSGSYTIQMRSSGQSGPITYANVPHPTQTFSNRGTSGVVQCSFNLGVGTYTLSNIRFVVFNGVGATGQCFGESLVLSSLSVNCPAGGCSISAVSIGSVSC